jgi:hypothetical protein
MIIENQRDDKQNLRETIGPVAQSAQKTSPA